MTDTDTQQKGGGIKSLAQELPLDRLKDEARNAAGALASKAASSASDRVSSATKRLSDYAENGGSEGGGGGGLSLKDSALLGGAKAKVSGDNPVMGSVKGGLSGVKDKVKNALGGGGKGGKGGGSKVKVTNIVESIDVGVPVSVAYNAWTEFQQWSGFMKKVEHAERQKDETKVDFKAQVFWSHRSWTGNILEEVPDERIVWRSKGDKGTVDGAVTFHELGPNLTRILVVLEYHPQGFFEKTGNIWRAQGRRARLELKHFRRHVMTRTILHPDDVEGWRGEIRDGDVVESHDDAVQREQEEAEEQEQAEQQDQAEDTQGDEAEGAEDSDESDGASDEDAEAGADDESDEDSDASDEDSDEEATSEEDTEDTDEEATADADSDEDTEDSDEDTEDTEDSDEDAASDDQPADEESTDDTQDEDEEEGEGDRT